MGLKEKISDDMKSAMKQGNTFKKNVTRMLLSELKYAQTAINAKVELDEDSVLKVISSYHKKLTKSLDDFPEGEKRNVLLQEIQEVEHYLPKTPSLDEIDHAIESVLKNIHEPNFGAVMKAVMHVLGNYAPGKVVSERIKARMS